MGGDNKHFQLCLVGCTMYILSYVISICRGQVKRCLGCSNHGKCRGCCIWKQKPNKYLNWINHFNLNKLCWLIDLALLKQTIALHQSWVAPYNQDLCYMLFFTECTEHPIHILSSFCKDNNPIKVAYAVTTYFFKGFLLVCLSLYFKKIIIFYLTNIADVAIHFFFLTGKNECSEIKFVHFTVVWYWGEL